MSTCDNRLPISWPTIRRADGVGTLLEPRARSLGWQDVVVIDDDLGRSGGGIVRPGFDRLLSAICSGSVGAVLAIEVSRLARNGRDWHTLIEFCALVGSLILDEDGVYDPRSINDRLLLGMKGTFSELELSLLRQRSLEALRNVSTTLIHPGSSFRLGTALLAWGRCHSPAASSFARFVRILAD